MTKAFPGSQATINFHGRTVSYCITNDVTKWRVDSFYDKEPETIKWLSTMTSEDIFFDVGANVGMYSVFAASLMGATVYAFEPESQNFAVLCKNILLNKVQDKVYPLCAAITNELTLSNLNLSRFDWDGGGSCHSFGEEVGFNLQPRISPFKQLVMGLGLDQLIEDYLLPVPTYLKVDVDGFEHKVINGASKLLLNPKLKTICIELNTNLADHNCVITYLMQQGFFYNSFQVNTSLRSEGPFKGCSEFIFYKALPFQLAVESGLSKINHSTIANISSGSNKLPSDSLHLEAFKYSAQKLADSVVESDPFPCIFLQDFFPTKYYQTMQELFPSINQMKSIGETGRVKNIQNKSTDNSVAFTKTTRNAYAERYVTLFNDDQIFGLSDEQVKFWVCFEKFLSSPFFVQLVLSKFSPWINHRLVDSSSSPKYSHVKSDSLLVRDLTNYHIGPHTDLPHRLVSLLFYMPSNADMINYGTSLYKPKKKGFTCDGHKHHSFEKFDRLGSVPFLPNSLFLFAKTPNSFHGVQPLDDRCVERKLLINNIRVPS